MPDPLSPLTGGGGGGNLSTATLDKFAAYPIVQDSVSGGVYSIIGPHAAYDATSNKTFLAYHDNVNYWVVEYDHALRSWSIPRRCGTRPAALVAWADGHHWPSLCLDADGYIHLLFGAHGGAVQYAKSTSPRNIEGFTAQANITFDDAGTSKTLYGTYPKMVSHSDGNIYVLIRPQETSGEGNQGHDIDGSTRLIHERALLIRLTPSTGLWTTVALPIDHTNWPDAAGADVYHTTLVSKGTRLYIGWFAAVEPTGASDPHDGPRQDYYVGYWDTADNLFHNAPNTYSAAAARKSPDNLANYIVDAGKVMITGHLEVTDDYTVSLILGDVRVENYTPGQGEIMQVAWRCQPGGVWASADLGYTTPHGGTGSVVYDVDEGKWFAAVLIGLRYESIGTYWGGSPFPGGDLAIFESADGLNYTFRELVLTGVEAGDQAGIVQCQRVAGAPSSSDVKFIASGGNQYVVHRAVNPIWAVSNKMRVLDMPRRPSRLAGKTEYLSSKHTASTERYTGAGISNTGYYVMDLLTGDTGGKGRVPPNATEVMVRCKMRANKDYDNPDITDADPQAGQKLAGVWFMEHGYDADDEVRTSGFKTNEQTADAHAMFPSDLGDASTSEYVWADLWVPLSAQRKIQYRTQRLEFFEVWVAGWKLR